MRRSRERVPREAARTQANAGYQPGGRGSGRLLRYFGISRPYTTQHCQRSSAHATRSSRPPASPLIRAIGRFPSRSTGKSSQRRPGSGSSCVPLIRRLRTTLRSSGCSAAAMQSRLTPDSRASRVVAQSRWVEADLLPLHPEARRFRLHRLGLLSKAVGSRLNRGLLRALRALSVDLLRAAHGSLAVGAVVPEPSGTQDLRSSRSRTPDMQANAD